MDHRTKILSDLEIASDGDGEFFVVECRFFAQPAMNLQVVSSALNLLLKCCKGFAGW